MDESGDNGSDAKEAQEPSITSDDPNERKLARRRRIQKRLDEAARLQSIKDGTYVEPEKDKPVLDQAIENSEDALENLFLEGKELVSNVRVASDAREVERRENEIQDRLNRLNMLEEDATIALEKLNDITRRWELIQDMNDPLNLHESMKEQKAKCLELIQQKNDLIKNFQEELKMADEKYMKDRRKMYEDLSLLTQRIDEQVIVMKKAYRLELNNIEGVIDVRRIEIMEEHQKTWQSLYNRREKDEVSNMSKKFKMVDNHEAELDELHKEHEERFRENRIKLETDIQTLEQELERVKALCLLNSEKLDYNYQVLRKREEENVYIKNHQKRKLNKLQDVVNTLKKRIDDKQSSTEQELKKLKRDVVRYHANVNEIERKAEHFSQMNEDTYQNIWDMKSEEARAILNRILAADRIIHEQILGIPWTEPTVKLFEKTELPSFKTAKKVIDDLFKPKEKFTCNIDLVTDETSSEAKKLEYQKGHRNLLKKILQMVADQSGFLVEEKLDDLLKPYTSEERTLVRLDNVFTAIGVHTEKDVNLMKTVFLPYAVCPICDLRVQSEHSMLGDVVSVKQQQQQQHEESSPPASHTPELDGRMSKLVVETSGMSIVESPKGSNESAKIENLDPVQLLRAEEVPKATVFHCNITHPLMIEKIYVLNALKDFVVEFHAGACKPPTGMAARLAKKRNTISRLIAKEDVEKYWQRYKQVFPEEREVMWDAMFQSLKKYYEMLQDRHKLNLRAQKLRRQNQELRKLLSRYMSKSARTGNAGSALPEMGRQQQHRGVVNFDKLHEIIREADKYTVL